MPWDIHRGMQLVPWLCSLLMCRVVGGQMSYAHSTLSLYPPHLYYMCPAGATAKLVCAQRGAKLHAEDQIQHRWLFNPHGGQHCHMRDTPRHFALGNGSHAQHGPPPGVTYGSLEQSFWMVLENVTALDQGRYCCVSLDIQVEHKHGSVLQRTHSHIVLHVTPRSNGSQECTVWDPNPPEGSMSAVLATAACIVALLALPLIMLLVYKQRQSSRSNRAHELVRMDSEAQGHDNPVFLGGSPQPKTRTVSHIMTRQASETGRHLLSEPGTPFTPHFPGEVFFPVQDPIPESPNLMQM